jgi:PTS system mannose-specific IID component
MSAVSKPNLFRLYLRSFLIQTGFTYERLLALGFAWILIPLLKSMVTSAEKRRDFLRRHLLSFNANPYLTAYAVGAVARMEKEDADPQQIIRFKELMRGPLGAVGDNLIWQNLRPTLLFLGVVLAGGMGAYAALVIWLMFNLYQAYLRGRGIYKGYALGLGISSDLGRGHLQMVAKWSGRMGAALAGLILILVLAAGGDFDEIGGVKRDPRDAGLLLVFVVLSVIGFKRCINPGYVLLGLILLCLFLKAVLGIG